MPLPMVGDLVKPGEDFRITMLSVTEYNRDYVPLLSLPEKEGNKSRHFLVLRQNLILTFCVVF